MQRTTMEGTFLGSQHRNDQEFDLREWRLRARISRENTSSRRYSASYLRSFREDSSRSFRSNFTISSTASSPGYHLKDEIDPSTYSFTTALKALQARSGYVWECLSPEGFALNSKWNEAERYICNPLSGEVPMECLSAKTLSGRSFRSYMASRVTMSAPLVYSMQPRTRTSNFSNKVSVSASVKKDQLVKPQLLMQEKHIRCKTRDVGIQSTPPPRDEGSTSSPSAASTPSIRERSIKRYEDTEDQDEDVQNSSSSVKSKVVKEVDVKVTREGEETREKSKGKATLKTSDKIGTIQRRTSDKEDVQKKKKKKRGKRDPQCTCNDFTMSSLLASWRRLWAKRLQQEKSRVPPKLKKY